MFHSYAAVALKRPKRAIRSNHRLGDSEACQPLRGRIPRVAKSGAPCRIQPPPPANEIAWKPMVAGERESWTPCVPVATSMNHSVELVFRALGWAPAEARGALRRVRGSPAADEGNVTPPWQQFPRGRSGEKSFDPRGAGPGDQGSRPQLSMAVETLEKPDNAFSIRPLRTAGKGIGGIPPTSLPSLGHFLTPERNRRGTTPGPLPPSLTRLLPPRPRG